MSDQEADALIHGLRAGGCDSCEGLHKRSADFIEATRSAWLRAVAATRSTARLTAEVERLTAQLQAAQAAIMLSDEQLFEAYRVGYHQITGTAAHPNGLRAVQAAIRAASIEQAGAER